MQILRASKLTKGEVIGIVSPASTIADPSKIERGVRYLESLGYRVKLGTHLLKVVGYLAGTDEERVEDLHAMFRDKRVKAILCVRGGYGTPRILHLLDYTLIRRNPKIFSGFSDITALHLAIWKKTRLITFHGPMLGVDFADQVDAFTEEHFWRSVTSATRQGTLTFPEEPLPSTLFPGIATGRLLGGNLALIISIFGTAYQPDFGGSLFFVEDIGEEPYRIDRMLMQLRHGSVLSSVHAVLSGQFTDCAPKDATQPSLSLAEIFSETARAAGKPFLTNLPFGHTGKKMTLPVGLKARVDAGERTLEFLESAVT
jgi:muramoyltetrapeptide carboxypeptidase